MFQRIVAAIDNDPVRSAKVLEAAGELARGRDATVLVAHVKEVERPAELLAKAGAIPPSLRTPSAQEEASPIGAAVDRLLQMGVKATAEEAGGSTAAQLLEVADAYGSELIIVGDRGSTVGDMLQGGVAHRIVHLAGCPVLVVR